MAVKKLLRTERYAPNDNLHALSALSHRIGLDIILLADQTLASGAVQGHMRFVQHLSQDRMFITTTTPSEPLLSLAAMQCLTPVGGDTRALTATTPIRSSAAVSWRKESAASS